MYNKDERIVLTLDAGGTNFVFSAIQGCNEIIEPIHLKSVTDNLELCLSTLVEGFTQVINSLPQPPVAISFAFPGPADYEHGIIGDLPNFSSFRGGVALGPYLNRKFGLPVFINNDGNLYAYGEALAGKLPEVNALLKQAGSSKVYKNVLGITLGTGFGAGVVINGNLLTGDNGCGGDVWLMRNKFYPDMIAEEGVSIRAIRRSYHELSGEDTVALTPYDVFQIAEGARPGNREAAIATFRQFGETAGDAICHALDIVDGLVVVGGGVIGAAKYILPGMFTELHRQIGTFAGNKFQSLQMKVYDLTTPEGMEDFLKEEDKQVQIPFSNERVSYACSKKTGLVISSLGASKAISLGAYTFALAQLDKNSH